MKRQPLMRQLGLCLLGAGLHASLHATELVYTPVNPSFGGNPLNGTYLLNNAQAQNKHSDPELGSRLGTSALSRFSSQLESRLLNQLLTNIENGQPGTLTTSAFIIDILDEDGVLSIVITERASGQVSEIIVDGL